MGLKDYKVYKRNRQIKEFFEAYGISEADLRYLPEALKAVKELKKKADEAPVFQKAVPSEEEKKKYKERSETFAKPEDVVAMFKKDAEEFYPNGRAE